MELIESPRQTRTATGRIDLDNADGIWRPGLFVNVAVTSGETEAPVTVTAGAVQTMEKRLGGPLVNRATGGKGGGGATLSEAGQRLVDAYRSLEAEHARQVTRLNDKLTRLLG